MTKRICGLDTEDDVAAVRTFYRDEMGCAPDTDIGEVIEFVLSAEADELLPEFGLENRDQLSAPEGQVFCEAGGVLDQQEVLISFRDDTGSAELERRLLHFFQSLESFQATLE